MENSPSRASIDRALHVLGDSEGWCVVESDGGEERRFETKNQALQAARKLGVERGVEVVVHGADGSIQERDVFVR